MESNFSLLTQSICTFSVFWCGCIYFRMWSALHHIFLPTPVLECSRFFSIFFLRKFCEFRRAKKVKKSDFLICMTVQKCQNKLYTKDFSGKFSCGSTGIKMLQPVGYLLLKIKWDFIEKSGLKSTRNHENHPVKSENQDF